MHADGTLFFGSYSVLQQIAVKDQALMLALCIKTKMVLYILLFFTIASPVVVYLSLTHFRSALEKSVEEQQFLLVSRIADELDHKVSFSHNALKSAALAITPETVASPGRASAFVDERHSLLSIFDNGLYLFSPGGILLADSTGSNNRIGMDFSYRDYFKQTIKEVKPIVSSPYASSLSHHHPVVMFTVPVKNEKGDCIAILGGSLDLMRENFLGALSKAKIGTNGYFSLTSKELDIIMHPDTSLIMNKVTVGKDRLFDRALKGFEGAGRTDTFKGIRSISAYKRLIAADWLLSANYPEDEALSPLRKATWFAWSMVLCGGIATISIFWLVTRKLISPLIYLTEEMRKIRDTKQQPRQIAVGTNDEVKELATVFNRLMLELQEKEQRLESLNISLEQRIAERTEELETANKRLQAEVEQRTQAQEEISFLNDDLHRRATALEQVNCELESFSYSISHDLRAPVRHIRSFSEMLLDGYGETLEQGAKLLVQKVSGSACKLETLINYVLDLSRVSRIELAKMPISLTDMARETAGLLRDNDPERKVTFEIQEGINVYGDPVLMQLVIQNLLENAWKYSRQKDTGLIQFKADDCGDEAVFSVEDNGVGFDMKYADKLFTLFQRLHSAVEYEGTGIGLATVQRIIHRHGGRIWGKGEPGKGATFSFTLGCRLQG